MPATAAQTNTASPAPSGVPDELVANPPGTYTSASRNTAPDPSVPLSALPAVPPDAPPSPAPDARPSPAARASRDGPGSTFDDTTNTSRSPTPELSPGPWGCSASRSASH